MTRAIQIALLTAACLWGGLPSHAITFRRSFKNGYPAKWNVSKEEANDVFSIKRGGVTYSNGRGQVVTQATARTLKGRVTRVVDGDRIWVTDYKGRHKVRLFQIDAPELEQAYGKEAEMIEDGCAWYDRRTGPAPHYTAAEKKAREAKLGLWADPAAINPMNFRRASSARAR